MRWVASSEQEVLLVDAHQSDLLFQSGFFTAFIALQP